GGARSALVLALAAVVVVVFAVVLRKRVPVAVELIAAGGAIVLAVVALAAYPQATNARLVVLNPAPGGARWSIGVEPEGIGGATAQTGPRIVLAGTDDADHDCEGWQVVRVTIDLTRREVVKVYAYPPGRGPTDPKPRPTVAPD